jgi:hypothetical protein
MRQLWPAVIGLAGIFIGILTSAWRQTALQRDIWLREDLRRWQQDRRESYLRLVYADDELYRCLIRDLRDPPPGRAVDDPKILGLEGVLPPPSAEQRLELLNTFDRLWRAKREIELFHLIDDELLASANRLALTDAELVGLVAYDLHHEPERAVSITTKAWEVLQGRRQAINDFIQKARVTLDVPPGHLNSRIRR